MPPTPPAGGLRPRVAVFRTAERSLARHKHFDHRPRNSSAASRKLALRAQLTAAHPPENLAAANIGLHCATAGSTLSSFGHKSFAVFGPLALLAPALYPVSVRRFAVSLPASFTPASRSDALRFAWLAVTSLREDFHLQVDAHAGRTKKSDRVSPVTASLNELRNIKLSSYRRAPLGSPRPENGDGPTSGAKGTSLKTPR